jgi:hypothetical protein
MEGILVTIHNDSTANEDDNKNTAEKTINIINISTPSDESNKIDIGKSYETYKNM